ncbi:MAG: glycosyltransferase [Kaiparowitsia implicata GSE-PSE-MK54-09C]|nr:glycosyltransferase [Kaiparowitsia implicata GSE-PSE-MK54-09C]
MRVVHVVPSLAWEDGGPSAAALGMVSALAEAGVAVTLLTTDAGAGPGALPISEAVSLHTFRCWPSQRYKFSPDLLRWMARHAGAYDVAHIHALFSPVSTAAAWIARQQGLPYVLRPLGTLDPADLQKKHWLKLRYGRWLEAPNLANAAAIHFTSEPEAAIAHRFGVATRDVVLPLGVSLPSAPPDSDEADLRAQWGLSSDCPIVLFLGRFDRKKGIELLMAALEQLQAEGVAFHWILAGANPYDPAYEKAVGDRLRRSPLQGQTIQPGFVTGALKASVLGMADVSVLPSAAENFGIAVAEAMLASIPVVISEGVQIHLAVQSAGAGWVVPRQVDALTDCLRQVLQNPAERHRRGQAAQQLAAREYAWGAIAPQLIALYQQILASA